MSNLNSRVRSQKTPIARNTANVASGRRKVTAQIAASDTDIEKFNDLLREKKRLHNRVGEQRTVEKKSAASVIAQRACVDEITVSNSGNDHRPHGGVLASKGQSNGDADIQTATHADYSLRISLGSNATGAKVDTTMGGMESKTVESIVAVIQRIVMNQRGTSEKKRWSIQLGLPGQAVIDIALEYSGKDEWQLGFSEHDRSGGRRDRQFVETGGNPVAVDDMEALYHCVEAGLKMALPRLRITELHK